MPHALAGLVKYAMECIQTSKSLLSKLSEDPGSFKNFHLPGIPDESMEILKECVEFGDPDIAKKIAVILGRLQIQSARLETTIDNLRIPAGQREYMVIPHNIESDVLDAAEIYELAARLLNTVRSDLNKHLENCTLSQIERVLSLAGIDSESNPGVLKLAAIRYNQ